MNQVELLLRLSENAQDMGDEIAARYNEARAAHVKELQRLEQMITVAKQNIDAELRRFGAISTPPAQLHRQDTQQDSPQPPRVGPPLPRPVKQPDAVKAN